MRFRSVFFTLLECEDVGGDTRPAGHFNPAPGQTGISSNGRKRKI
jgi:hypothetical protein